MALTLALLYAFPVHKILVSCPNKRRNVLQILASYGVVIRVQTYSVKCSRIYQSRLDEVRLAWADSSEEVTYRHRHGDQPILNCLRQYYKTAPGSWRRRMFWHLLRYELVIFGFGCSCAFPISVRSGVKVCGSTTEMRCTGLRLEANHCCERKRKWIAGRARGWLRRSDHEEPGCGGLRTKDGSTVMTQDRPGEATVATVMKCYKDVLIF